VKGTMVSWNQIGSWPGCSSTARSNAHRQYAATVTAADRVRTDEGRRECRASSVRRVAMPLEVGRPAGSSRPTVCRSPPAPTQTR